MINKLSIFGTNKDTHNKDFIEVTKVKEVIEIIFYNKIPNLVSPEKTISLTAYERVAIIKLIQNKLGLKLI